MLVEIINSRSNRNDDGMNESQLLKQCYIKCPNKMGTQVFIEMFGSSNEYTEVPAK